ncbi:MAG: hypothetical protein JSU70_14705 [Phycisphaerales bacterium]|nr:MAG: hypothetical protein JSU70_14705 [Phycisphaerales bacterium]
MNSEKKEDLRELFERFSDSETAEKAAEEVRRGEQVLGDHPAPEPDEALVAGIKLEIGARLSHGRRSSARRVVWEAVAAAAVVIVLIAIGSSLFRTDNRSPGLVQASIIPRAVWESDDIATDDLDLASFKTEIEHIEDQVRMLQSGENGKNGDIAVEELEMELAEINSDFWKG